MASTATATSTPSGGVSSSMWANQPNSGRTSWRSGESGSAFRGIGRGSQPRGRGSGRGGRNGRGGGRGGAPNAPRPDEKSSKPDAPANHPRSKSVSVPAPPTAPPATAAAAPAQPAPTTPAKTPKKETKPNPRRASQKVAAPPKVPPIVIQEAPPAPGDASPASTTASSRSRRKRSSTHPKSASSSKKSLSTESSSSQLRPEKPAALSKDPPPHLLPQPPLTPSFDIKHDIDALVERVRAVAMDRPNTPGSHIDWAGDDDDSLPDLDDWGVKSTATDSSNPPEVQKQDLISPIMVDGLKPLPTIGFGSPLIIPDSPQLAVDTPEPTARPNFTPTVATFHKGENAPVSIPPHSKSGPDNGAKQSAGGNVAHAVDGNPIPNVAKPTGNVRLAKATLDKDAPSKKPPAKLPIHPSLPPKPVTSFDTASKVVPRKPPPPLDEALASPPTSAGLSESIHASQPPHRPSDSDSSPERGLSASMHALTSSQSAPSHIEAHSVPSFQPSHSRAYTVGRVRSPLAPGAVDDGGARETKGNHSRTQSLPYGHPRAPHARPVITGDALSKLARTLNGERVAKREASALAAKE